MDVDQVSLHTRLLSVLDALFVVLVSKPCCAVSQQLDA